MLFLSLFIIGTAFWSFSTVLIERWHSGKWGIVMWRSECPKCHSILSWKELFPIFSYLFQGGKCHSCKVKIPAFYPVAELFMGTIFLIMGVVFFRWTAELFSWQMFILFILWFITGVYVLYDAKFMEVPDQVMVPWIYLYLILIIWSFYIDGWQLYLFDSSTYESAKGLLLDHISAAIILYSFFYIQILIPGMIFLIKKGRYSQIIELFASYILFPITLPFQSFIKNNTDNSDEIPSWIGWWDLRIALFIGLTLGTLHGMVAFFIAYCIWSIVWIGILMKNGRKNSQIPFWPFLGIGWLISIYFHNEILMYMTNNF